MDRNRELIASREHIPKYLTQRLAENVQQAPSPTLRERLLALIVDPDRSLLGDLTSVCLVVGIPTQTIAKRHAAQYARQESMLNILGRRHANQGPIAMMDSVLR